MTLKAVFFTSPKIMMKWVFLQLPFLHLDMGRESPFFIYLKLFIFINDFEKLNPFSTTADFCDFRLISVSRGTFVAHRLTTPIEAYIDIL
jgi:hypothetical protein